MCPKTTGITLVGVFEHHLKYLIEGLFQVPFDMKPLD